MKRWLFYLIVILLIAGALYYFALPHVTGPLDLDVIWKAKSTQNGASVAKEPRVAKEILELRQRHVLRPLTDAESGTRTRELAGGIYGFATCDGQTLTATRTNSPSLEIHKHRDGIAYYVGYASEEQIEKYLTRQKNFHILASLEPREQASLLFEIPIDFVSKCTLRSEGGGTVFDLFVTAIPELQTHDPTVVSHVEQRA
ncbi:MAG TPA: hypothetical protein VJR03_05915 [Nitrospira sp.]|nr:hypothetical protein [Nitrospira sp.]